jgi:hypothetical protein
MSGERANQKTGQSRNAAGTDGRGGCCWVVQPARRSAHDERPFPAMSVILSTSYPRRLCRESLSTVGTAHQVSILFVRSTFTGSQPSVPIELKPIRSYCTGTSQKFKLRLTRWIATINQTRAGFLFRYEIVVGCARLSRKVAIGSWVTSRFCRLIESFSAVTIRYNGAFARFAHADAGACVGGMIER